MRILSCKHTHLFEIMCHLYFSSSKLLNYKYVHIVKPKALYLNKEFFFFSFFLFTAASAVFYLFFVGASRSMSLRASSAPSAGTPSTARVKSVWFGSGRWQDRTSHASCRTRTSVWNENILLLKIFIYGIEKNTKIT